LSVDVSVQSAYGASSMASLDYDVIPVITFTIFKVVAFGN